MSYEPTAADISYPPPIGSGVPPVPGTIIVPQSPSGTSVTNTGETETATQTALGTLEIEGQQGLPAMTSVPVIAGCPNVQANNWNSGAVGSQGNKFS